MSFPMIASNLSGSESSILSGGATKNNIIDSMWTTSLTMNKHLLTNLMGTKLPSTLTD